MNRNFEDIYEKLTSIDNIEEINIITKRKNITLIIFLIFILILMFFYKFILSNNIVLIIFFVIFISILMINISITKKYKKIFKEIIIKKMISLYNEQLIYFGNKGISEIIYRDSGFYKDYDKFYSEDLISGKIKKGYMFSMAQVRTKKTQILQDNRGKVVDKEEEIVFDGLYGFLELMNSSINSLEIDVAINTIISKYKNSRIEVDSAEFEKNYDIFSNDKIKALQIFTPEVIDELNNFKNNLRKSIQIRIKNGKLFFNVYLRKNFRAT